MMSAERASHAIVATDSHHDRPRSEEGARDPLVAFSVDQVIHVTGLSRRELRYWDATGLFSLSDAGSQRRTPSGRIYLYRDVVDLRTLAILRNQHHMSLQELRKVGEWLARRREAPWSNLRFYVSGGRILFEDLAAGAHVSLGDADLGVVPIEMADVERDTRERALRLRDRQPEEIGKITRDRAVESNGWVLAGTRVPTEAIWDFHEAGHDTETVLAAYPSLTPLDVERAIAFERQRHQKRAG